MNIKLLKTTILVFIPWLCLYQSSSAENDTTATESIPAMATDTTFATEKKEAEPGAVLYVYRPADINGALVSYKLNLGDSTICRVRNNWCQKIELTEEGDFTLWAQSETKDKMPIHIDKGGVYFIRCSVLPGFFVGHPYIELMDEKVGLDEYLNIVEESYETIVTLNTGLMIKCHLLEKGKDSIKIRFIKNGEETTSEISRSIISAIDKSY